MLAAAKHMNIDFQAYFQVRKSSEAMATMITDVVAEESPDVLVASIPNDQVHEAIAQAARTTHVFTLNSGADEFLSLGSKAHFSMDEHLGGYKSPGYFNDAFAKDGNVYAACAVVNPEPANHALSQRREGYKKRCEELGLVWFGEFVVDNSDVDAQKLVVTDTIQSYLDSSTASTGGLGLLFLAEAPMYAGTQAWIAKGKPELVKAGCFDPVEHVYDAMTSGFGVFGISQNEWLQGYLSVLIPTIYISTGNLMAPKLYPTGPSFVTEVPTADEKQRAAESFPICDCPWAGGLEDQVSCGPTDAGIEPIGACPLETGQCLSPCVDVRRLKLRGVLHADESNTFWYVLKAGAEQAANDLRLIDFEFDLFGPPGSDRSDAYTNEKFAQRITDTANDPSVDGIFIAVMGPQVHAEITDAASKKVVVTVNSGYDVSHTLNPEGGMLIGHVGQDEGVAGVGAANLLFQAGAKHVVCVLMELNNMGVEARCNGAVVAAAEAGTRITKINLVLDGVDPTDDDQIAAHYASLLAADSSIDSILTGTAYLVPAAVRGAELAGKQPGQFWIGTFDSSEYVVEAIEAGKFVQFGVDQQQYMQGYMAVMYMFINLITGQKLAEHLIMSGPFFKMGLERAKDTCIALKWVSEANPGDGPVVGERMLPSVDSAFTYGFPVCENQGSCKDESMYFDEERGECRPCSPGYFKNASMVGCAPCPAGSSTNGESGSRQCVPCLPGYYALQGNASCMHCETGDYSEGFGQSACLTCAAPFSTEHIAQTSNSSCKCPEGMYGQGGMYAEGGQCVACPEAMECGFGSHIDFMPQLGTTVPEGTYPLVEPGYMTLASAPLTVYKCKVKEQCVGGKPGSCADLRDATQVACGACHEDAYETGNVCSECGDSGLGVLPMLLCFLVGIACISILTLVVNRDNFLTTFSTMMIINSGALVVTSLQSLGVFNQLAVGWFEPVRSLFKALSIFSLDLKELKVGCLMGASNPVPGFVTRQLLAPLSIPFIVITVLAKKHVRPSVTDLRKEVVNTAGTIFNIAFISIIVSAVGPFVCYRHPGASGWSMQTEPSILCDYTGLHSEMVIWSCLSLLLVACPFMAVSIYSVYKYPTVIISPDGYRFAQSFRFLYLRFKAQTYYYGLVMIARSLIICLVPVVIRDEPGLQIFFMIACVGLSSQIQQKLRPWRADSCNDIDPSINLCMILILLCGAMASEVSIASASVRAFGTAAFVIFAVLAVSVLAYGVYSRMQPRPFYHVFFCHHQQEAAAQVRLLRLLVTAETSKNVLVDWNGFACLDSLMDCLKCKVAHFVAYITNSTLKQPWCACEIVTALKAGLEILAVITPGFVPPTQEQLRPLNAYVDMSSWRLVEHGVRDEDVVSAVFRLLDDKQTKTILLSSDLSCSLRLAQVAAQFGSSKASAEPTPILQHEDMIVISASCSSDEAAAAGAILAMTIFHDCPSIPGDQVCILTNHEENHAAAHAVVASARAVIFAISACTTKTSDQLMVILDAMLAREADPSLVIISVAMPDAEDPSSDFYSNILPKACDSHSLARAAGLIRAFFMISGVVFPSSSPDWALDAQIREVVRRIPDRRGAGKKQLDTTASALLSHPSELMRISHGRQRAFLI